MPLHRYFLVTSLPSLGDLGSPPPMSMEDMLVKTADFPRPDELVRTLFLADDLQGRDAYLSGEIVAVQPVVLSGPQARNEQPLPEPLAEPDDRPGQAQRILADLVWAAYYRHAEATARRLGSDFLARWVSFEVSLRNALATERAAALGLEPNDYLVVPELGRDPANLSQTLAEWNAARTPLDGLRILDRRRWAWLHENDAWFSFADDEIAAYAAKLMLLVRWERLGSADQQRKNASDDSVR